MLKLLIIKLTLIKIFLMKIINFQTQILLNFQAQLKISHQLKTFKRKISTILPQIHYIKNNAIKIIYMIKIYEM
jgi:hypothetical protein